MINVHMDWEESVFAFIEGRYVLIARGFGELAIETIGPAVI